MKKKEKPGDLRLLAIDVGSKRMGLALWSPEAQLSSTLPPLKRIRLKLDLETLEKAIKDHHVEALLVGIPNSGKAEKSSSEQNAEFWVQTLREKFALPLFTTDESLSTQEALHILEERGIKLSSQTMKEKKDSLSAALFLEDFIRAQG